MRKIFTAAFLAAILAANVQSAAYRADPASSRLQFKAKSRFSTVTGRFGKFDMTAEVDEGALEKSTAQADIEVASLDTGIKARDRHLRSEDFFDAAAHPRATLVIRGLARNPDGSFLADAELTIRGIARPLSLPARIERTADGLRVSGETSIKRKDFHIDYDSRINPIRDEVLVSYDVLLKK